MIAATGAEILYLDRLDCYKTEKPFEVVFDTSVFGEHAPQTNVVLEPSNVTVFNARRAQEKMRLNKNGFEVFEFKSKLHGDDFEDEDKIRSIYYEEARECHQPARRTGGIAS